MEVECSSKKVIVPKEIGEWLEIAKEDVLDYEVYKLKKMGFLEECDTEVIEMLNNKSMKCGINQLNIFRCLSENADCGISQWMGDTTNSFKIVSKALMYGYEISGSIED